MGVNAPKKYPVIIVGGGMVGLTCAAILSKENIPVAIIETQEPELDWAKITLTPRVSAINMASYRIFDHLNLWSMSNTESYSPLRHIKVWDKTGGGDISFDSADLGKAQLGFIVENREIVRLLWEHLKKQSNVDFYCPELAQQIIFEKKSAILKLKHQTLTGELVVGADGGHSWVRSAANISCKENPYHQKAIIAAIKIEKPHHHCAFQVFLSDGILAALPLSYQHHMAIVWSLPMEETEKILLMPTEKAVLKIKNAFSLELGNIELISPLQSFPLIMRHAENYVKPRIALIGDAAHSIHPLAGQGVNLGLLDAACLAQCVTQAKQNQKDIGSLKVLRQYERWRKGDNCMMIYAMRGFKELFGSHSPWLTQIRSLGLKLTDKSHFTKNLIMRYAMGNVSDLPDLAKELDR